MDDFKIEKGIPIPLPRKRGRYSGLLERLEFGDSIVMNIGDVSYFRAKAKHYGFRTVVRRLSDQKTVRVWMVDKE